MQKYLDILSARIVSNEYSPCLVLVAKVPAKIDLAFMRWGTLWDAHFEYILDLSREGGFNLQKEHCISEEIKELEIPHRRTNEPIESRWIIPSSYFYWKEFFFQKSAQMDCECDSENFYALIKRFHLLQKNVSDGIVKWRGF